MGSRKYFFGLVFTTKVPLSLLAKIYNTLVELSAVYDFEYTGWAKKNVPKIHFRITKVKRKF